MGSETSGSRLQLVWGTLSFAVCFAAWGLISAFAPRFRELFQLTATQTALLVAVPVVLGGLLRIVTGMLADRFGGRAVFAVLMLVVAVPAYIVPSVGGYRDLLYVAFFLGIAGSSFAVGVGFVSRWFPPEKQGGVLGIYGLGNIGQSAVVFLGPLLAPLSAGRTFFAVWQRFSWHGAFSSSFLREILRSLYVLAELLRCCRFWQENVCLGCCHFSTS